MSRIEKKTGLISNTNIILARNGVPLNVINENDPKPRVFITLKFRVNFTLNYQVLRNQR
jgi:hypothetical protein